MKWTIDPSHTSLELAVKHMAISTVRGRMNVLEGEIETDDQNTLKSVRAVMDANSIQTGDATRDAHLRSPDFLNAEQHPQITYQTKNVEKLGENRYRLQGELTMAGQTRPVSFEAETSEAVTDPWGNTRAAATASGRISRKDWGLVWNQTLEFGGVLVSDDVRFTLDVQAVQAKNPAGIEEMRRAEAADD